MSIIKVKAYWFHVRERGVLGAIFGTFISAGRLFRLRLRTRRRPTDQRQCAPDNLLKKIFTHNG